MKRKKYIYISLGSQLPSFDEAEIARYPIYEPNLHSFSVLIASLGAQFDADKKNFSFCMLFFGVYEFYILVESRRLHLLVVY